MWTHENQSFYKCFIAVQHASPVHIYAGQVFPLRLTQSRNSYIDMPQDLSLLVDIGINHHEIFDNANE